MQYCEKCGVHVRGSHTQCPLCQGSLTGVAEQTDPFPEIPFRQRLHWLLLRLLALGTVLAAAVCIAVNICIPGHGWWSLVVVAGLLSGWLAVGLAVRKRGNPLKAIVWQVCVVTALVLAWDFGTGFSGWSVTYVLPVLFPCAVLAIAVIARALRMRPQDFLWYLLLSCLFGLSPAILLAVGLESVSYFALASVVISVVMLAALILFEGAALRSELHRRMHL